MAQARVPMFLLSVDIYDTNIFTWFAGIAPLMDTPQNQCFERLNFWCQCFLIRISSRYFGDDYFDIVWGASPRGPPKTDPPKNQFFDWLKLGH